MNANPIAEFFSSADTKFYIALITGAWAAFKGFNWVRDIRDKDLKGIKEDLGHQNSLLGKGFETLSAGIDNLRSDLRTFYTSPDPLMIPVSARTTRKRKSVAARTAAKEKKVGKTKP